VTVSLVLDLVSPYMHDSALLQVTTYTVLAWRLIRIVHGAFVAAEGAVKRSAMHHAQTLRKLLGSIGNSKMLLEILQQKLASPPELQPSPKAEMNSHLTPRATQLIQQIFQEEKKMEALNKRESQLFEIIDSLNAMVSDQEGRLKHRMDHLHEHVDKTKTSRKRGQSKIKLGIEQRRSKGLP